jgi:hypothetical protein
MHRWSTMPNPKDYCIMNISSSAIDILVELQTILSNLSINLLKNVFNEIRARIIMEFDEFLFNCVWRNEFSLKEILLCFYIGCY